MKTILVAVDLSPQSRRVCDVAIGLAQRRKARLMLLNVAEPPTVQLRAYGFAAAQIYGMQAALEKRLMRKLLALGRGCRARRVPVRAEQITGRAASTIVATARRLKADTIVLGTHGHGAAFDLVVGSIAQGVIRAAPCPVLVVPGRPRLR